MSLTPTPSDQCTQQLAEVNPIGLRATAAPIDLHARRVDHEALDATRLQEARQPKGVVARLVAEYDRWLLAAHLRPTITGRDELCHQAFAVAAFDRIDARLLTIGKLDTQQPRLLAQLYGAEEPIRRSCGVSCSIHLPVSPLRPITTWTKEIAGRLRRPSSRLIASLGSAQDPGGACAAWVQSFGQNGRQVYATNPSSRAVHRLAVIPEAERVGDLGVRLLLCPNDHVQNAVRVLRDRTCQPASSPRSRDAASDRFVDGAANCRMLRLGPSTGSFPRS